MPKRNKQHTVLAQSKHDRHAKYLSCRVKPNAEQLFGCGVEVEKTQAFLFGLRRFSNLRKSCWTCRLTKLAKPDLSVLGCERVWEGGGTLKVLCRVSSLKPELYYPNLLFMGGLVGIVFNTEPRWSEFCVMKNCFG